MLIEKFPAWKNGETVGLSAEIKPLKFRFGNAVHSKLALEFDQECSIMHFSHALFGQFKYWPQKFMLRSFNGFYNEFIFLNHAEIIVYVKNNINCKLGCGLELQ